MPSHHARRGIDAAARRETNDHGQSFATIEFRRRCARACGERKRTGRDSADEYPAGDPGGQLFRGLRRRVGARLQAGKVRQPVMQQLGRFLRMQLSRFAAI